MRDCYIQVMAQIYCFLMHFMLIKVRFQNHTQFLAKIINLEAYVVKEFCNYILLWGSVLGMDAATS